MGGKDGNGGKERGNKKGIFFKREIYSQDIPGVELFPDNNQEGDTGSGCACIPAYRTYKISCFGTSYTAH